MSQLVAGYEWRQDRVWELAAWKTAHLLNVSGKTMRSRVTAKKLLKKPTGARDQANWWARVEAERGERKRLADEAVKAASENGGGN